MSFKKTQNQFNAESEDGKELPDNKIDDFIINFKKTIKLPQVNTKYSQFIICPVGLVKSGKTTILKMIQEKYPFVIVSTDDIRRNLRELGYNYIKTKAIAFKLVKDLIDSGYSIALDADCAGSELKQYINNLVETNHLIDIWIHIATPEKIILNRFNVIDLNEFKGKIALDNYYRRKPLHEKLDNDFLYVFNKDNKSLDIQIKDFFQIFTHKIKKYYVI